MLARIINGELQQEIPITGMLLNGRWVSGYNALSLDTLKREGWKETTEIIPTKTKEQYLVVDTFTNDGAKIIVKYKAVTRQDFFSNLKNNFGEL